MTIVHHLDDATILAYAAGTLGEALSVAAACHISMCSECRTAVRKAEALGGEILDDLQSSAVSDVCRAATLGRLNDMIAAKPAFVKSDMPSPLQRLLGGQDFAQLRWRKKAPGVAVYELPLSKNAKGSLKLLSIAPGMTMLEHGHGGEELTLVLKGAFKDKVGRFVRGDIADLDQDTEHCPIIEEGETCICLYATEAPSHYKTWIGRLLQPILGI
ncbi:MAG TPA: ChrR family anti-sigma-E factor [Aestuariivirga sp.]|nr:ChrR family anti-sigma-E factor [Aestuariivirga sp.]